MTEPDVRQIISLAPTDLSLSEKLDSLPIRPGVYQFRSADGKTLYIGKAANLRNRVRQYFHRSLAAGPRIQAMVAKIADVELIMTDTEVEALILESNLIKQLRPRYNVVLKDDKGYPYIIVTKEPFPRVFVTRRRIPGAGRYFGPYTDVTTMRFALKTIRGIFLVRSCNFEMNEQTIAARKFKVCLDYHIKKCDGPCEGHISQEQYGAMIRQVESVLEGRTRLVVEGLRSDMTRAADELRFEDAARLRDRIKALDVYIEKQSVIDDSDESRDMIAVASRDDDACGVLFRVREGKVIGSRHYYIAQAEGSTGPELLKALLQRIYAEEEDLPALIITGEDPDDAAALTDWLTTRRRTPMRIERAPEGPWETQVSLARVNAQYWLDELAVQRLKRAESTPFMIEAVKRDLRLAAVPKRIECIDISNTQGTDSVASLVVFVDGKPRRSEYRTYGIKTVEGANDFASMAEVVRRRFERALREQTSMPDLLMVDGGRGQLSSATQVLTDLGLTMQPIVGLAKRLEEIYLPGQAEPLLLPKTSPSLRLLQQVRDEAHRFAVAFHRKKRSKRLLQTELDLIAGVGKKRAAELLEVFGSVQGVKFASSEQLAEVVGEKTAERIAEYFMSDDQATESHD